jgi:hypothetical protein
MVTNQINFDEIEQKTSKEFVQQIINTVNHINTSDVWDDKEIQFYIEEDEYTLTVLMCFGGNISKYQYRFSTERFDYDNLYWTDIRKFFDIPLKMEKIEKTA